jgi:putative endonuclease
VPYYVYILSSRSRNLYTGVTNNITCRVAQHRFGSGGRFTSRYKIQRLEHLEPFTNPIAAIKREKEIKGWLRAKKIALIEAQNPGWIDLAEGWFAKRKPAKSKLAKKINADPSSLRSSG